MVSWRSSIPPVVQCFGQPICQGATARLLNPWRSTAAGNVWSVGIMQSDLLTIPNTNGWTTGIEFLVGINASGSKLSYSAQFPFGTTGQSVVIDRLGLVYVAGVNGFVSAINPTTTPTMKSSRFRTPSEAMSRPASPQLKSSRSMGPASAERTR